MECYNWLLGNQPSFFPGAPQSEFCKYATERINQRQLDREP
jgi:hypothetical protein